jgi:hypothetical protein
MTKRPPESTGYLLPIDPEGQSVSIALLGALKGYSWEPGP